jgi:D-alanyl-D-alanine carboxypeptidase (penicillin-binding protein 5/6)
MRFSLRSLFVLVFVLLSGMAQAQQVIIPAAPQLAATSYILIDADTGKVLVEHNADMPVPPASLTKMMTSYIVSGEVAAGRLNESDLVFVSDNAWRKGGSASGSSTMFLEARSKVSVIDMMRGLIIQSGGDAAIALAEHLGGSEEAFADIMNQQAQILGMQNSHFKNATGWPTEGHTSTARDMALLGRALIKDHPEHYSIYSEKYFTHNNHRQGNRNKLLWRNKFVDGIKTGHTKEAKYCLVASAKRDGMRLISVVMGAATEESRAAESQRLLAYGFRYYQTHRLYQGNATLEGLEQKVWKGEADSVHLYLGSDAYATIPRGSQENLVAETQIDSIITAPISQGQELGELIVKLDGEAIYRAPLLAADDVPEAGFFSRLWDGVLLMFE